MQVVDTTMVCIPATVDQFKDSDFVCTVGLGPFRFDMATVALLVQHRNKLAVWLRDKSISRRLIDFLLRWLHAAAVGGKAVEALEKVLTRDALARMLAETSPSELGDTVLPNGKTLQYVLAHGGTTLASALSAHAEATDIKRVYSALARHVWRSLLVRQAHTHTHKHA